MTLPSWTILWSMLSGTPPKAATRSTMSPHQEPGMKLSGMVLPVPDASLVLKASRASCSSSTVLGIGMPSLFSHAVLMAISLGNCTSPSSSMEGRE
ncbi:hypothetical protein D9M72_463310 [compost metagenome]